MNARGPRPPGAADDPSSQARLQQFATLLAHAPDAIVIVDEGGQISEWNPAAEALLGWSREDSVDTPVRRYLPAESRDESERIWARLGVGERVPPYDTFFLRRDGTRAAVSVHVGAISDGDAFLGAVATLRSLAPSPPRTPGYLEHDELTGLVGRTWLQRILSEPLAVGMSRGVALVDVDAFALVNLTYGPEVGDAVLRELGLRLEAAAGQAVVGRWQADEFICVVEAHDPAAVLDDLADKLLRAVRAPFAVGEERLHLTVSAGLVTRKLTRDGDLLRAASAAMRAAKETGRDRAVWYDVALRPAAGGGMRLANDLHRGIERDELRLLFQPIVALSSSRVVGVEALVRWDRPGVGLVGPAYFMDVAEQTGQVVALGAWVTQQACHAAMDLSKLAGGPLTVSINLSARQLSDPDLVGMLRDALEESGCPPASICVEVTETALMRDMAVAASALEAMKALGVGLDLDDFGTGYSSLLYLKHFPVDRIKIDQSFVRGLGRDADDTAIVASTIALAHSVGLQAIAEGVETTEQRLLLQQMGCDFAQGFLFSGPLSREQLLMWLAREAERAGGDALLAAERDQAGEQRDHDAEERDHAADRRDDAGERRDQAGEQRDLVADERDHAGDERDDAGGRRDQAGDERDQAADRRDRAADRRDEVAERSEAGVDSGLSLEARSRASLARREAASDRLRASLDRLAGATERTEAELDRDTSLADRGASATERTEAELDRDTALADRGAGASEREHSETDRNTALADRDASAGERETASVDDLTGAYLRAAGFQELEREIARATRSREPLVLAFIDVDHLKLLNDSRGHAAGDRMLLEVAHAFRAKLRAHDLFIRYGGDEFVCAISGLSLEETTMRLTEVQAALAQAPERGSVTVGLAELLPGESAEALVARADAALYRERERQRGPSARPHRT